MSTNNEAALVGCVSLVPIVIALAMFVGWCLNIHKLTKCDFAPSYKAEVIRVIGVACPPIGGVIGYADINDDEV